MAAPAGGIIGARALLAGVDDFFAGLTRISEGFGNFAGAGGPLGSTNTRLADATAGFQTFDRAIATTEQTVRRVGDAIGLITSPIRAVGSAVTSVASEVVEGNAKIVGALADVANAGAGITERGAIGFVALGAAVGALGTAAIVESAKYERGMKDIEAVSQTGGKALDDLDGAIQRVAARFPASIEGIQRAALELAKAGVPIDAIKTSILDLAVAAEQLSGGELTAEQAAEGIGANLRLFARSFEESGDSVEKQGARIVNSVTAIANATRATLPEVFNAVAKAGPNLSVLGQTIEQTAAAVALPIGAGLRGQEAGTFTANLVQRLERPSAEAQKILQARNISLFDVDTGKARNVIDVLNDIASIYGRTAREASGLSDATASAELAEVFQTRTLRGLNIDVEALDSNLVKGVDAYGDYLAQIANTDVIRQAQVQNEALLRQLGVLRNQAQLAGVAFGRDFVAGLGAAVVDLNDFVREGEKAQAIAGVLGKASAAILTGRGTDNARAAVADSPFGEGGAKVFDALESGAGRVREALGSTASDAGRLGQTLASILFPGDTLEAGIERVADGLVLVITFGDKVIQKIEELAPTGAAAFGQLVSDITSFAQGIARIFTENNGEESFNLTKEAALSFLGTVRNEAGPTVESLARLGRAVVDNGPELLALASTAVRVFSLVTRAVVDTTTAVVNLVGAIERSAGGFPRLAAAALGGPQALAAEAGKIAGENFVRSRIEEDRAPTTLRFPTAGLPTGVGGFPSSFAGVSTRSPAQAAFDLLAQTPGNAAFDLLHSIPGPEESDAARAARTLTPPAGSRAPATKEEEAAAKALAAAQRELDAEMRTLDKDIADVGGSFDKTIAGAQQRWLDGLDQIAQSTEDAFRRIQETASEGRRKAIDSFNLQSERQGGVQVGLDEQNQLVFDLQSFTKGTETVFREDQEDRKRIFQEGIEDRRRDRQEEAENDTTAASRLIQDKERIETQGEDTLARIRARGIEDRETIRQRGDERELLDFTRQQERLTTAFTRGQQREAETFSRGIEDQNTARLRRREDTRRDEQLARDLGAAATPEDRTRVLQAFTEDKRRTAEQRKDQAEDTRISRTQQDQLTKFRQGQEDSLTKFRQGQEDKLTKFRQDQEDVVIAHRRELENNDISYRIDREVRFTAFRRDLEDRETVRRRAAQRLEVTQQRADQLEVLGFERNQQQEAEFFRLTTERIPDLQRQLTEIDTTAQKSTREAAETALRETARAGATFRREIGSAEATASEATRRLLERFDTQAASLIARLPEGPAGDAARAELTGSLAQQRAVLQASLVLSDARLGGRGAAQAGQVDTATQQLLAQLGIIPGVGTTFNGAALQAPVTTNLISSPQVDRLTRAIANLTDAIEKVPPGTNVGELNVTLPASPTTAPPGGGSVPLLGILSGGAGI